MAVGVVVSDALGRLCFSNAPFRWLKRTFFHRWVLWSVGATLAVGLPLALVGVGTEAMRLVLAGYLITLPFQLWVAILAGVSFILAVPRFAVFSLSWAALYVGLTGLSNRLADWAAKYEDSPPQELR